MATLAELVAALDGDPAVTTTTSVRQPVALREALQLAVELGMGTSANDATSQAVRTAVEIFATNLALDEHYAAHPTAKPALHEVAHALAVVDRSPLAGRRDLLKRAAREVVRHRPDADADDVLLWALALLEHDKHAAS